MYMAQKRHQSPIYNQGMQMGGGQYMRNNGHYGPQGGYPMGHPHNMGGGPGPGFSGMPPGMHGRPGMSGPGGMGGGPMVSMQGGQFPTSSSSSGHHLGQPNMRPGGPDGEHARGAVPNKFKQLWPPPWPTEHT